MWWRRLILATLALAFVAVLFAAHDTEVAIALAVISGLWILADFLYRRSLRRRPGNQGERAARVKPPESRDDHRRQGGDP